MNVLITRGLSANMWIRRSWMNAFNALGMKAYLWEPKEEPAFDIFHRFKPDAFIGSFWDLDRATLKLLSQTGIPAILNGNNWGTRDAEKSSEFPIDYASSNEIELATELKKSANVKHVLCQYHQDYANETHDSWRGIGYEPLGLLLSADVTEFLPTIPSEDWRCDVGLVSGYWPYKSKYLQEYIVATSYPNTRLKLKIFGDGWSIPQSFGRIDNKHVPTLYASATVSPNIFEPHSIAWGYDVNSRTYQVASCLGFQVCQKVESVKRHIFKQGEVVWTERQADFLANVNHYKNNPAERLPFIEAAAKTVWREHTNFHRAAVILQKLGFEDKAQIALSAADQNYNNLAGSLPSYLQKIEEFHGV